MKNCFVTGAILIFNLITAWAQNPVESDFYTITDIPIPEGLVVEVTGIELLPEKRLAVCSRRGDIYIVENAYDDEPGNDKWGLYASGLHEPIGLSYHDGWLWCAQRPEVTRMKDVDADGRADIFECISDDWGIDGSYHEYSFGSKHDSEGNIYILLCLLGSGDYRGWCMKVNSQGELLPFASGIRSPGGVGYNHLGDLFCTDNQGTWNGTSSLKHLSLNSFQGHPNALRYFKLRGSPSEKPESPNDKSRVIEQRQRIPQLVPPAVNFPHGKIANSPGGMCYDGSGGKFGPFHNQLFVNDQFYSNVTRVYLEKVKGVYQGACFPFRKGFGSGNVPNVMDQETGSIFVGGTNRGWGSVGKKMGALERLDWSGKLPFEILKIEITPTGFKLEFTKPLDEASLKNGEGIGVLGNSWIFQSGYGSPEVDRVEAKVLSFDLSQDKKVLDLHLDKIFKGHTYHFDAAAIRAVSGEPLLHGEAYYTVNEVLSETQWVYERPKMKVLIVDGANNHSVWPLTTLMMKQYLEESGLFEVRVNRPQKIWNAADHLEKYLPLAGAGESLETEKPEPDPNFSPEFDQYDVVISNFGHGAPLWPEQTRKNFEHYLKNGGGFVVVHAANNSFPEWDAYSEMIGISGWRGATEKDGPYVYYDLKGLLKRDHSAGRSGGHGSFHEFPVTIRDSKHPITKGMPKVWLKSKDECYARLRGPAKNMTVLATGRDISDKAPTQRHEPVMMVLDYHQGRVFHLTLGHHSSHSFEGVGFITCFKRGTEWAASGEVTQSLPNDFPTHKQVSLRPFKLKTRD